MLRERISLLREIDDKAMRTVRTAVVVLGLVVSANRLSPSQPDLGTLAGQLGLLGSALLTTAVVVGTYTYAVSDVDFGVGSDHRREVRREAYTQREWLQFQLGEYDE